MRYFSEKLDVARTALMLPHTRGEAASVAECFHNCALAFDNLPTSLDSDAQRWISTIREKMDVGGLSDPDGRGLWQVKAERLTTDDLLELSEAVDELASWADRMLFSR